MDILQKISYVVFICSFLCLFLLYLFVTPEDFSYFEMLSLSKGSFSYTGEVLSARNSSNILYLDLASKCSISGVFFLDEAINTSLLENSQVIVSGHIDSYKGEKQYVFDELVVLE